MKRFLIITLLFSLGQISIAQDLDQLMTKRYISCADVEYNCSFLIPDYYREGKTDSLDMVLDYWSKKCGENNVLFQTKTLLEIENGTFDDKDINRKLFDKLVVYRRTNLYRLPGAKYYWSSYPYSYTGIEYLFFLDSLANEIQNTSNLTTTEDFVIGIFNGDKRLYDLETEKYAGTFLSHQYRRFADSIMRIPEFTFTFYSGIFIPTQSAGTLGPHGIIGFGLGGNFYKNSIDLMLDFKFGAPSNSYEVLYNDSVISSDVYTGMYVGLEYGRTVLIKNKSEYYVSAGAGGERITAVYRDDAINQEPKFLWSPIYSVGLGYRYRYNYQSSLSLQFRYQYLDFDNPSGTQLEGNAFTIRILWTWYSNGMRKILPKL